MSIRKTFPLAVFHGRLAGAVVGHRVLDAFG